MAGNSGNSRDTRQRGNAAQLLEKYKNMARDSQLAGDRVQTEYFLQFADHYFRVLGEGRARFEEQRRPNGDDDMDDDGEEMVETDGDGDDEAAERPRRGFEYRDDDSAERPRRRTEFRDDRGDRGERPQRAEQAERDPRRERRPAPIARSGGDGEASAQRIPFDALPPAIGAEEPATFNGSDDSAPAPRRTRRARPVAGEGDSVPS